MVESATQAVLTAESCVSALKGLRIALIVHAAGARGGSERQLQMLVPALIKAGAEVRVFSATEENIGASFPVEARQAALADSMHPFSRFKNARAAFELSREIAAQSDVVDFQRIAPWSITRRLAPLLPTVHSVLTAEQTCPSRGRYLRRSSAICARAPGLGCLAQDRREQCLSFHDGTPFGWRDRVHSLLQLRRDACAARLFSEVTFNSHATAALYARHVGRTPASRVIHPPLCAPAATKAKRNNTRLAFAGRVEAYKGAFDLLDVLEALPGSELDILGEGSALPALRDLATKRGLAARIRFHGWLEQAQVAACLAEAACLLMPSRLFEAWGMVGPEAIAQGCPVVAYDSGGAAEWCTPDFGTLVPVGDVAAMARAAGEWLNKMAAGLDTSSWGEIGEARWGLERYVREYAQALQAAISSFKALK